MCCSIMSSLFPWGVGEMFAGSTGLWRGGTLIAPCFRRIVSPMRSSRNCRGSFTNALKGICNVIHSLVKTFKMFDKNVSQRIGKFLQGLIQMLHKTLQRTTFRPVVAKPKHIFNTSNRALFTSKKLFSTSKFCMWENFILFDYYGAICHNLHRNISKATANISTRDINEEKEKFMLAWFELFCGSPPNSPLISSIIHKH